MKLMVSEFVVDGDRVFASVQSDMGHCVVDIGPVDGSPYAAIANATLKKFGEAAQYREPEPVVVTSPATLASDEARLAALAVETAAAKAAMQSGNTPQ